MAPYLLGLRLDGRRVLVAGGGGVAQRRVPILLAAGADVTLVSPDVTPALEGLAAGGSIRLERRRYRRGDCAGAWLVQACTDDPGVNQQIVEEAEQERIWSVRADDATASPAWTPASGRSADVVVGILAEADPRRAAGIRDAVIDGLHDGTLEAHDSRAKRGGVALVGGGPGDPALITVRGRQLLARADVVVADRLAPLGLLDELRPDVEVIDAAKLPYRDSVSQDDINRLLIERARAGRFVVRLKGGDPFVLGRGAEEVLACAAAGVPVEVVPGVTSATGVPGHAGVPVTHRGVTGEVHVISGHLAPDDPDSTVDWASLGRSQGTLVLLMAVERLATIADVLMRHGRPPRTPVAVIQDGTMPTQRQVTATLATVAEEAAVHGIRPPAIIVIGDVVGVARQIEELQAQGTSGK